MLFFFAPGMWVSRQIWNLEKKERLFTWCSDKIDKWTTPNVKVFVFGSLNVLLKFTKLFNPAWKADRQVRRSGLWWFSTLRQWGMHTLVEAFMIDLFVCKDSSNKHTRMLRQTKGCWVTHASVLLGPISLSRGSLPLEINTNSAKMHYIYQKL